MIAFTFIINTSYRFDNSCFKLDTVVLFDSKLGFIFLNLGYIPYNKKQIDNNHNIDKIIMIIFPINGNINNLYSIFVESLDWFIGKKQGA